VWNPHRQGQTHFCNVWRVHLCTFGQKNQHNYNCDVAIHINNSASRMCKSVPEPQQKFLLEVGFHTLIIVKPMQNKVKPMQSKMKPIWPRYEDTCAINNLQKSGDSENLAEVGTKWPPLQRNVTHHGPNTFRLHWWWDDGIDDFASSRIYKTVYTGPCSCYILNYLLYEAPQVAP
jgi:hypothetical protein